MIGRGNGKEAAVKIYCTFSVMYDETEGFTLVPTILAPSHFTQFQAIKETGQLGRIQGELILRED
jgi:hypothetical protein